MNNSSEGRGGIAAACTGFVTKWKRIRYGVNSGQILFFFTDLILNICVNIYINIFIIYIKIGNDYGAMDSIEDYGATAQNLSF